MKILGLDVGEKRIGVARADSSTRIAIPCGTIEVDGTEWEQINRFVKFYDTKLFVLGLPRSNEGNETTQSLYARNFAKILAEKIPDAHIRFQDESLTSIEAEKRLKARKKSYEKGEIDAEAASIILQDFIENFNEKPAEVKKDTNIVKKTADKTMLKTKTAATKSKNLYKKLIPIPISLFLIILIILSGILWYRASLNPVIKNCNEKRCPDLIFAVNEGASVDEIANDLKAAELIQSSFFFKTFIALSHKNDTLKSGDYTLNKGLSTYQIADILIAGSKNSNVFNFTILPGETIFNIKTKLQKIGYSAEEIEIAFTKDYDRLFLKNRPEGATLEGYLYGETLEFYKDTPAEEIIEAFLDETEKIINENHFEQQYAAKNLTLHEGITLASIVQKEAYTADQPTVAQVFLTRLKLGIPLGSDVTVTYALDIIDPERKIYNNNEDALKIDSPYNTRKYLGLTPGPISSPSLSALKAVANPSGTDYLYFLTGDDGKMYYSYTEEEHNQNAIDHCQVLCEISL